MRLRQQAVRTKRVVYVRLPCVAPVSRIRYWMARAAAATGSAGAAASPPRRRRAVFFVPRERRPRRPRVWSASDGGARTPRGGGWWGARVGDPRRPPRVRRRGPTRAWRGTGRRDRERWAGGAARRASRSWRATCGRRGGGVTASVPATTSLGEGRLPGAAAAWVRRCTPAADRTSTQGGEVHAVGGGYGSASSQAQRGKDPHSQHPPPPAAVRPQQIPHSFP